MGLTLEALKHEIGELKAPEKAEILRMLVSELDLTARTGQSVRGVQADYYYDVTVLRYDSTIVARLFHQRVDFFQRSRYPCSTRWWGVAIDVQHDDVKQVFASSNWLVSLQALLQTIAAGEPHAAMVALVLKFATLYGVALALIDRGNGVRNVVCFFCV